MGMGGAFTAISDDINAPLYNPAGIMLPDTKLAGFMYAKLYSGLEDVNLGLQHAAFILPADKLGAFGLTWASFASASELKQDTLIITYAKDIPTQGVLPELYGGVNLKYLNQAYVVKRGGYDEVGALMIAATVITLVVPLASVGGVRLLRLRTA